MYAAMGTSSTMLRHVEKADDSTETDEDVEDTNEEWPLSKQDFNDVEIQSADEPPVDRPKSDQEIGNAAERALHEVAPVYKTSSSPSLDYSGDPLQNALRWRVQKLQHRQHLSSRR